MLATPIVEKLNQHYPDAIIDFLVRKGNESLLANHPVLRRVLVLEKQGRKYTNLLKMASSIRRERYDYVINVQRFFATGLLTMLSGAKEKIGFNKNPLSLFYTHVVKHDLSITGSDKHEVERNLSLVAYITDTVQVKPRLYPSAADFEKVARTDEYICIAPASVWFTKQFPVQKWIELIKKLPANLTILLIGAKSDITLCEEIKQLTDAQKIEILAGKLSFLESAALMSKATMNFVNDSAPLHFASAMNAPVTAVFCSTIPAFGFGPLSDISLIGEIDYPLYCRPCGLHGYKACPEGHFKCSDIQIEPLVERL